MSTDVLTAPAPPHRQAGERPPCGSGVILCIDREHDALVAIPTFCHRWDCEPCAQARLRQARAKAAAGKPQRMLTLTTRPNPNWSLDRAVPWLRKCQAALFRRIRKEFGNFEYMSFLELHKSDWPHLHILTRGCYIPQRILSAWWAEITGSHRVYIQAITQTWKGIQEATKYYLKSAQQVHSRATGNPVYTLSRHWLPDGWTDADPPPGNYEFFCFCRLTWDQMTDLLLELDPDVAAGRSNPQHLEISLRGPPPEQLMAEARNFDPHHSYPFLAALTVAFAHPTAIRTPTDDLIGHLDYLTDPTLSD